MKTHQSSATAAISAPLPESSVRVFFRYLRVATLTNLAVWASALLLAVWRGADFGYRLGTATAPVAGVAVFPLLVCTISFAVTAQWRFAAQALVLLVLSTYASVTFIPIAS
jgi:hypothetical protein